MHVKGMIAGACRCRSHVLDGPLGSKRVNLEVLVLVSALFYDCVMVCRGLQGFYDDDIIILIMKCVKRCAFGLLTFSH